MSQSQILDYAQTCLILVLRLSLIPIIVATVIGILVSLLQALSQIPEQTLGFAVKLIAISLRLLRFNVTPALIRPAISFE